MLRGVWQALNCLSIHATYCVIIAGVSPGETKMWAAVRENGDFLALAVRITGKLLKIDGYMLWSAGKLALTVLEGIMEGLRHQGRPRRQWIHDIEEWTGCECIQLKKMSQDRAQWRRKISEWSSAVANPHRGRLTSEWVSEWVYNGKPMANTYSHNCTMDRTTTLKFGKLFELAKYLEHT